MKARTGARRRSEIPDAVLAALDRGEVETVNLVEFLAVDLTALLENVLPGVGLSDAADELLEAARAGAGAGVMERMAITGRALGRVLAKRRDRARVFAALASHRSDVVRDWAAFTYLEREDLPVGELLEALRPFAADPHFAVRECAWLAGRRAVIADLSGALRALARWVRDPDPNVRRFASELTRPRGVWCPHIVALRDEPERASGLLEPLRADPARYVQDSVGNWLNDASKSRPDWVLALARRWSDEPSSPHTARIVTRGLRSLAKTGGGRSTSGERGPRVPPGGRRASARRKERS